MPITNLTRGTRLAESTAIANTPLRRMQGLIGKNSIHPQEALIITPCKSIHMLFMKFSIDAIFLNKENKVVGLVRGINPFGFSPIFWESSCVIELSPGTIEKSKTHLGDQLSIK